MTSSDITADPDYHDCARVSRTEEQTQQWKVTQQFRDKNKEKKKNKKKHASTIKLVVDDFNSRRNRD